MAGAVGWGRGGVGEECAFGGHDEMKDVEGMRSGVLIHKSVKEMGYLEREKKENRRVRCARIYHTHVDIKSRVHNKETQARTTLKTKVKRRTETQLTSFPFLTARAISQSLPL